MKKLLDIFLAIILVFCFYFKTTKSIYLACFIISSWIFLKLFLYQITDKANLEIQDLIENNSFIDENKEITIINKTSNFKIQVAKLAVSFISIFCSVLSLIAFLGS